LRLGAKRAYPSTTRSAYASSSSRCGACDQLAGTYCVKQLISCFPLGARESSTTVGITPSEYGAADGCPYFASSKACSRYSIESQSWMNDRAAVIESSDSRPSNRGSSPSARLTLTVPERDLYRSIARTKSDGSWLESTSSQNVIFGWAFDTTARDRNSVPSTSATPTDRLSSTRMRPTRAPVRISAPCARASSAIAWETAPVPPRTNAHSAICPSTSPM